MKIWHKTAGLCKSLCFFGAQKEQPQAAALFYNSCLTLSVQNRINIILVLFVCCSAFVLNALSNFLDRLGHGRTVNREGTAAYRIFRIGTCNELGCIVFSRDVRADCSEDDLRTGVIVLIIDTVLLIVCSAVYIKRLVFAISLEAESEFLRTENVFTCDDEAVFVELVSVTGSNRGRETDTIYLVCAAANTDVVLIGARRNDFFRPYSVYRGIAGEVDSGNSLFRSCVLL